MTKRIMIVPDTPSWIIGKLSEAIIKHNPHFEFNFYCLHPRDVQEKIGEFKKAVEEFKPDVIHFQYYRSCSQALELWPELKNYKIILTHHNQKTKAIFHKKWGEIGVDKLVCHTQKCKEMLIENGDTNIEVIQHGIDLDYFSYNDVEPKEPRIGYVGRIVQWKGLLEICKVARELKMQVLVMGRLDKAEYWKKIEEYKDVIDFTYFDCKDEDRINAYRAMTIYVGNSIDGYEEGPMGLLEAWASGVPVITTPTGEARDLAVDGENARVIDFGHYEELKSSISETMADQELRKKFRKNGWSTVKNMTEEKMAREYSSLYYKVGNKNPLVSVIIPATYDRHNEVQKIIESLENQTYKNIEAIIVWDEKYSQPSDINKIIKLDSKDYKIPIKFLITYQDGYNLAMARNMGIVEAEGEFILFNDARLCPEPDAIMKFMEAYSIPSDTAMWFFGDKGGGKRNFVENFSFVERSEVIKFGMMNERIDLYGGLSQDIRTRWRLQGKAFFFVEDAKATELKSSKTTMERRQDIVKSKLKLFKIFKNVSF